MTCLCNFIFHFRFYMHSYMYFCKTLIFSNRCKMIKTLLLSKWSETTHLQVFIPVIKYLISWQWDMSNFCPSDCSCINIIRSVLLTTSWEWSFFKTGACRWIIYWNSICMNIEEGPGQGHRAADRPLHLCQDDTDKGLRQQTLSTVTPVRWMLLIDSPLKHGGRRRRYDNISSHL